MPLPLWSRPFCVVIAGRPNVGKSTLFNRIVGRRISIEDPTPGITRDRIVHTVTHEDVTFDLVDTGGIGVVDMQDLEDLVELQIQSAIGMANVVIFVTDVRDGLMPLDEKVAQALRKLKVPVVLAVNKCDVPKFDDMVGEFFKLGFADAYAISSREKRGVDELLDKVISYAPHKEQKDEGEKDKLKLAVVGRRNVGKSSLINFLTGEERVIVSDVAGTTRDAVEVALETAGLSIVAIDTAGLRKKSSMKHPVEFYSTVRTETSVRRADVVVMMLDAVEGVSSIEKKLSGYIEEEHKPCIIVVNKWDLAGETEPEKYTEYIRKTLPGLDHCPVVYSSVKKGERISPIIEIAGELVEDYRKEWPTAKLNKLADEAWKKNKPRTKLSKLAKIFYVTQVKTAPPIFLVFVNDPKLFPDSYRRYLINYFRERLGIPEIPIRLVLRRRSERRKRK
ncbi:MAG: ribosome biogenesis GTPase Der [Planctomycetota bacterium]|nr:ribosome biogenesis GTPase Der [Planctomycetota bacterium]